MTSPPRRASGRSVNVAQLISLFLAFLMVAGVGGVLSPGFAMPLVAAVGATTQAGIDTLEDLDTEIGDLTLSERSGIGGASRRGGGELRVGQEGRDAQ